MSVPPILKYNAWCDIKGGEQGRLRIFKNAWFERFMRKHNIRVDDDVSDWERGVERPGGPALRLLPNGVDGDDFTACKPSACKPSE